MGNCIKENNYTLSSLSNLSQKQINIIEDNNNRQIKHTKKQSKSSLLSQISSIIIKEDLNSDQETSKSLEFNSNFQIKHNPTLNFIRLPQGIKIEQQHQIKLYNLHTQRYLHSHIIKHEHNKMNEVSTCNNCNYEYDWWQIQILNNKTYIFHPITNTYLCSDNNNNHLFVEVGCLQSTMDEWQIINSDDEQLKQNSIIKIKHINTGLYLHTQPYQSKIEDQHIVSLCQPNIANALWRIIDVQ